MAVVDYKAKLPLVCCHSQCLLAEKRENPMLPDKQKQAYETFYESTAHNDILDPKATIMIQLSASFIMGCYP